MVSVRISAIPGDLAVALNPSVPWLTPSIFRPPSTIQTGPPWELERYCCSAMATSPEAKGFSSYKLAPRMLRGALQPMWRVNGECSSTQQQQVHMANVALPAV